MPRSLMELVKKLAVFAAVLLVTLEIGGIQATPSMRKKLVSAIKTRSELPQENVTGTGSTDKVESPLNDSTNISKTETETVKPVDILGLNTNTLDSSIVEGAVLTHSEDEKEILVDEEKLQDLATIISANSPSETGLEEVKPSYITKAKHLLIRILDLLGFTKQRKSRGFTSAPRDNTLDSKRADFFSEEIKAAVGALMGKKQCMKRAVCGAGAFLRNIRGKEVLIIFLEKVAPQTWTKVMKQVKESAIYNDKCDYECVDA